MFEYTKVTYFHSERVCRMKKKQLQKQMKEQIIVFCMLIFLTLMSFATVLGLQKGWFPEGSMIYLVLLFGFIQILFQIYYFMHGKEEKTSLLTMFLFTGLCIGLLTVAGLGWLV